MKKIAVAFLTISILVLGCLLATTGCTKDSEALPVCWGTQRIKALKHLDGVRADFYGGGFMYREPQELPWGGPIGRTPVCPDQANDLKNLNLIDNFDIKNDKGYWIDSTRNYPYKVWGTIYEFIDIPNIIAIPTTKLWIEKVEEVR